MRIYVGGLGSNVQEDDLRKTFTSPQLGAVESVEIIRSKGRSFGYLVFTPASDKGLAKLFSTYNGCMWKGGRLKLEKATDDYLSRLRREWEEEAELNKKSSSKDADKDESLPRLEKPPKQPDIEKMQLKLYFPKLRKLKPIPLKGTGKHKYSFQRVEVPPLPIHFCDCEEHCGPMLARRNETEVHKTSDHRIDVQGAGIYEVNENELNMMKTILDKFLEKENSSEKVDDEMEEEVDDEIEEEASDDDDLLINVKKSRTKVDAFDWLYKATSAKNQDSLQTKTKSFSEPTDDYSKNKNATLDNKRKVPNQNNAKDTVPSEKRATKKVRHDSGDDPVITNTQSLQSGSDSVLLIDDVTKSRKSAWRNLARQKENYAFHISDILTAQNPEPEVIPRSNDPTDVLNVSGEDERSDESSEDEESEKAPDVKFTESGGEDEQSNESSEDESEDSYDIESPKPHESNEDEPENASDVESPGGKDEQSHESSEEDEDEESDKAPDVESPRPGGKGEPSHESSEGEESEKAPVVEATKPSISNDKIARGAAWQQKSSWLQLVADANSNSFSIRQILPGITFEIQEPQQNETSNLRSEEPNKVDNAYMKKGPVGDIGESQADPNLSNLTEEPNQINIHEEQPSSVGNLAVESDEASAPMHGSKNVVNYRAIGDVVISETCPFMRSSDSMKEWVRTKAALSGSHKKKGKGNTSTND